MDEHGEAVHIPSRASTDARTLYTLYEDALNSKQRLPTRTELARQLDDWSEERLDSALWVIEFQANRPLSLDRTNEDDDPDSSLYNVFGDQAVGDSFAAVEKGAGLEEALQAAMTFLTEREVAVLRYRYLYRSEVVTLEEVGKLLSLKREKVRQLERMAFAKLRHPSNDSGLSDFLTPA